MPPNIVVKKIIIIQKRRISRFGKFQFFQTESRISIEETKGFLKERNLKTWILIGGLILTFAFALITLILINHENLIPSACAVFDTLIGIIALFFSTFKNSERVA